MEIMSYFLIDKVDFFGGDQGFSRGHQNFEFALLKAKQWICQDSSKSCCIYKNKDKFDVYFKYNVNTNPSASKSPNACRMVLYGKNQGGIFSINELDMWGSDCSKASCNNYQHALQKASNFIEKQSHKCATIVFAKSGVEVYFKNLKGTNAFKSKNHKICATVFYGTKC